ncbi:YbaK/EbsC family protein [Acidisphaera sp. L21]|uniref:YbaK/EbsC family protein n=1 Tax=Acidisphaera sp. L21 TaxID=1641851 RepID=UPI0020B147B2|nr:YbaK/EbsC family protein [Acidisphaera sp. L21]
MNLPPDAEPDGSSVARVRAALLAAGHDDTIIAFPSGTRSAADAAAAIGCAVAQIAKSIVFRAGDQAVIMVLSGAARVDAGKAAAAVGQALSKATANFVRSATGFAIGGVSPVGHTAPCLMVLDESLRAIDPIWAAAGSPRHVFRTSAMRLSRLTGAAFADIAEEPV